MAELRELAEGAGLHGAETYIQSGNLVFSSEKPEREITDLLEAAISNRFGFDVTVLLRDARSFEAIASSHPFETDEDDDRFLVVAFLDQALDGVPAALPPAEFQPERYQIAHSEVYLHYPHGTGRAKLSNDLIERRLEVSSTMRNWRTVKKIAEMLRSSAS